MRAPARSREQWQEIDDTQGILGHTGYPFQDVPELAPALPQRQWQPQGGGPGRAAPCQSRRIITATTGYRPHPPPRCCLADTPLMIGSGYPDRCHIWLATEPADMRMTYDGLSALVSNRQGRDSITAASGSGPGGWSAASSPGSSPPIRPNRSRPPGSWYCLMASTSSSQDNANITPWPPDCSASGRVRDVLPGYFSVAGEPDFPVNAMTDSLAGPVDPQGASVDRHRPGMPGFPIEMADCSHTAHNSGLRRRWQSPSCLEAYPGQWPTGRFES